MNQRHEPRTADPSPTDPDELDPTVLGRGRSGEAPGTSGPATDGESVLDVLGRVAQTAAELEDGRLTAGPSGVGGSVVTETSAAGEVSVSAQEHRVLDLRLDPGWVQATDPAEVERLVRDTVNRALAAELDRSVQQLMAGGLGGSDGGGLAQRIAGLQTEAHRAFEHDLGRVLAPAHETVRRMDGAS